MPSTSITAPFRHRIFLALWVAALASHFGNAIQSVGAAWAMISIGAPADMVAAVQTMVSLPLLCFSLLGGAIADIYDRRRVMLTAQCCMCAASVMLALLYSSGHVTPWLLLGFTFALGSGVAIFAPSMQVTVNQVVPREDLAGAVGLNMMGFNVARSLGPAIGGLIVAFGGISAAFAVNASSYLAAIVILFRWKGGAHAPRQDKRVGAAIFEGLHFAATDRPIRTVLLRTVSFTLAGGAAWGLMPLVARNLVGGGASVFGLLLGALGFGAVLGASVSGPIRARIGAENAVRIAGLLYGAACLIVALRPGLGPSFAVLVLGGAGWVQALSCFMTSGQLLAPRAIVGRVGAVLNMATFGGLAAGAWGWGHIAQDHGIATALGASGVAMMLLPLLGLVIPLPRDQVVQK